MTRWIARMGGVGILLPVVVCLDAQERTGSAGARALIEKGNAALAHNRLHDAIEAFQRATDLDPSSAKAHERLGTALSSTIIAGNVRPSADSDVAERDSSVAAVSSKMRVRMPGRHRNWPLILPSRYC